MAGQPRPQPTGAGDEDEAREPRRQARPGSRKRTARPPAVVPVAGPADADTASVGPAAAQPAQASTSPKYQQQQQQQQQQWQQQQQSRQRLAHGPVPQPSPGLADVPLQVQAGAAPSHPPFSPSSAGFRPEAQAFAPAIRCQNRFDALARLDDETAVVIVTEKQVTIAGAP
jgi:hypothetical protein